MTSSTAQHNAAFGAPRLRSRTRVTRLTAALAALGAGAALALTGCGAGQVTQTGVTTPTITGNNVDFGSLLLRNVYIAYEDAEQYPIDPATSGQLVFTIVNLSPSGSDTLASIESFDAQVSIEGDDTTIPAGGVLRSGTPALQLSAEDDEAATFGPAASQITVEVTNMSSAVRPGIATPFTFTFEEAGDIVVDVPIEPGPAAKRTYVPSDDH
ncbi:hypothetical protein [Hoyosella subflava]|uniref:LpqE protein n=1 Tax=Hoyosella subflava (strain DSM 45089 / JCM 17490 / NBRC 109087 / DQS3-9A1) TaxID=443218 RepID=F6EGY6_HOYSD|nr:hypothetical protein [Hoyosella subflava]AEF38810.1 LpqE protein [Hoyosella subflava DQS3-9A1]